MKKYETISEYNQRLRLTAKNSTDKSSGFRFISGKINRKITN